MLRLSLGSPGNGNSRNSLGEIGQLIAKTCKVPFLVPTLEGQYIIKSLALISAGLVIRGTARGGGLSERPLRETSVTEH